MPKPKKQTWLLLLPAVLVVLCANRDAQPVVNSGSLY